MRERITTRIIGLLAFAILWSAPVSAGGQYQDGAGVVLQDTKPTGSSKKSYATVYDPLEMQGFSVALLLGETQGSSAPDNVPIGAKKALADLREFLPYKSYRLLDTQWIRCCAGPNVGGRLRGLDEQHYAFYIGINSISGSKMTANFSLTDTAAETGIPQSKKPIITSNFSMDTGETVVIGTSSLKGDKALVVLLTAVPRSITTGTAKKGSGQ